MLEVVLVNGSGMRVAPFALSWLLLHPLAGDATERWHTHGLLGYTTDYIDRGISQSDGHGSAHGEISWQHDHGFGVLLRAASVDFGADDDATAEVNLVAGVERTVGQTLLATSLAYVHFTGVSAGQNYDLVEISGDLLHEIRDWQVDLHAIYSPNESGHVGDALYATAGLAYRLTGTVAARLHGGYQWFSREQDAGPAYYDWGIGVQWTYGRFVGGLAYTDTSLGSACVDICNERVALRLEILF